MCKHMIVVFTRVDALNTPQNPAPDLASQRNSLEEKLQTASPDLQKILTDAGNRWIGVNNHVREDEQRKFVIKEITEKALRKNDRDDNRSLNGNIILGW
nr:hypothetical protein BaRGS_002324 [Batillaria attramentaria]